MVLVMFLLIISDLTVFYLKQLIHFRFSLKTACQLLRYLTILHCLFFSLYLSYAVPFFSGNMMTQKNM